MDCQEEGLGACNNAVGEDQSCNGRTSSRRGHHSYQQQQLSFKDCGRRVKALEALCWRCVEGRPCFSAAARGVAVATPLVVVGIPPTKASREQATATSGSVHTRSSAPSVEEQDLYWHALNQKVQTAAQKVQETSVKAGLNAALDLCLKRRPGDTFSHWEAQGVLLRLEVGANEAEEGTACLWAHKLHSAALQGIVDMLQTESKGQRVYGIPTESLPKVVHCLLEAIGSMDIEGLLSSPPPAPVVTHHHPPKGIEPSSCVHHHAPKPSSICPKLHISRDGDDKDEALCIDHLRWLVGAGRPCHCASERHLRMDELQRAISASWIRATGRSPSGWSVEGGTETIAADSSVVSGISGGSGEEQDLCAVAVVVGAIPGACNPTELKEELEAAFAPFDLIHVHGGKVKGRFRHGWARLYVRSLEDAKCAVNALSDGKLVHQGVPLTVSMSAGRLDTLFPLLPHQTRCKLRVDSVGAFSVTDQVTADKITRIIRGIAEAALLSGKTSASMGSTMGANESHGVPAAAGQIQNAYSARSGSCNGWLLPVTITDATACSGGNTLSFMSQFSNVNSVELDGDRVEDLRHNIGSVLQGAVMTEEGKTPLPGSAASMGHMTTYHDSYLDLMHSLRQDIVWLDPPWGGPEYNQGQRLEDLYLGDTAVSALCAFLLQHHANIVALRLPSSLAADTFLRLIWTSSHQLHAAETSLHRQDMTKQEVSEAGEDAEGCSFFVHDSTVQMGRSTLLILVKETSSTGDAASATSDESIPPPGPTEEKRRCLAERLAIVLRDTCRAEGGLHCRSGRWWRISKET